jgi:hypothetical protein
VSARRGITISRNIAIATVGIGAAVVVCRRRRRHHQQQQNSKPGNTDHHALRIF